MSYTFESCLLVVFAGYYTKDQKSKSNFPSRSRTASLNGRCGAGRCAVACFWVPPFIRHAPVSAPFGVAHAGRPFLWEQLSRANRVRFCPSAFRVASLHQFITAFQPMQAAFKKPVVSSSYSQSAAFAALASYSPSSGVQSKTRTSVHRDARTRPGRDIVTL